MEFDKVMSVQCLTGRRKDCPARVTCFYRHVEEVVGAPIKNYVNSGWITMPKDDKNAPSRAKVGTSNPAKNHNNLQCPHCTKKIANNHGQVSTIPECIPKKFIQNTRMIELMLTSILLHGATKMQHPLKRTWTPSIIKWCIGDKIFSNFRQVLLEKHT